MKLCLDLQGAQSESRHRGIGRYSLGLARAILASAGAHDVHIVLNGSFPGAIDPLRALLGAAVPQENFHVFATPGEVAGMRAGSQWRARAAEQIREAYLVGLAPDVVHVSSMFEGWLDDAVTSVGLFAKDLPTSSTLYDLIPLQHPEEILQDEATRAFYTGKLDSLKRTELLLAISGSARQEALSLLGLESHRVVDIGCGVDRIFTSHTGHDDRYLLRRHGIDTPRFTFYIGGFDKRKNVRRLVEAYAQLSPALRVSCPLVIGGSVPTVERLELERTALAQRLGPGELRFVGALDDATLAACYRAATLFVFPSLHEGFGLPAAEAMACGTAVVAAGAPGVRDVVGRNDALFDPCRIDDMARVMNAALTDEGFRTSLRDMSFATARRFDWNSVGARALDALESLHERSAGRRLGGVPRIPRPRLAYVSPMPPERTGIADYSAGLVGALSEHYEIDIIVDQVPVNTVVSAPDLPVRDLDWFEANAAVFDRVLYHIGNSPFHKRMIDVARRVAGVVVLHDFFRTGLLRWQAEHDGTPSALTEALYVSHGYEALCEEARSREEACVRFPACLDVLRSAAGTIVHSRHAIELARAWFGPPVAATIHQVPMYVEARPSTDRGAARRRLGLPEGGTIVVSLGFIAPTKLSDRLLEAWNQTRLADDPNTWLVYVGEMEGGAYGRALTAAITRSRGRDRIRVTGFVSAQDFDLYTTAADLAVQLRAGSRGESSWAILRCLASGVPVILNAHGSSAEFPAGVAHALEDEFDVHSLCCALCDLSESPERRKKMGEAARAHVETVHGPVGVARKYHDAIEDLVAHSSLLREKRLIRSIAASTAQAVDDLDVRRTAEAIARQRPRMGPAQLLVDVSVVARSDLRTGIERVVRGVLLELLRHPPAGVRVEPVRDNGQGRFVYARAYASRILALGEPPLPDDLVEVSPDDRFLGLDWYADGIPRVAPQLADWRDRGVRLYFVVYDLLPVLMPSAFPPSSRPIVEGWLTTIAALADGLVCISRAVADELIVWLDGDGTRRARPLDVGYFSLGSTIADTLPTAQGPADETAASVSAALFRPALLVVGTVEPRKAHAEMLAAFELLWEKGADVNLVIVGKEGWMMDDLARKLRTHAQAGRKLWWLRGVTDDVLERLYSGATGLIAPSKGEGFGLPLVEAARHGLPILARDLPVFREVAGRHATYFSSDAPADLATAIGQWLRAIEEGHAPHSREIAVIDWPASARSLSDVILGGRWNARWRSTTSARPSGADAVAPELR